MDQKWLCSVRKAVKPTLEISLVELTFKVVDGDRPTRLRCGPHNLSVRYLVVLKFAFDVDHWKRKFEISVVWFGCRLAQSVCFIIV